MFEYDMYTWISIFITVAIAGFTAIYLYCTKNDSYWKKRGVPYVPRAPVNEIMKQDIGKYERAIGSFEFTTPSFVLTEPDLLRDVLVKDFHKFHEKKAIGQAKKKQSHLLPDTFENSWGSNYLVEMEAHMVHHTGLYLVTKGKANGYRISSTCRRVYGYHG
ncbi:hypothetical protein CEXT_351211 [Caerostris extrusa]|uniref:Cytochrome P450 n=1 Tax=Caerostris extrusa TaxID=172846 RepID=A0AAV4UPI8_CAEEX|nr:hypothetical protein CEXT_351211 [Caerostris extrusa]